MMVLRLFEFETASSSTRANPSRRRLDRFLAFAMSKRKKSAKTLSLWSAQLVPYPTQTGSDTGTVTIIAAGSIDLGGGLAMPDLGTGTTQFVGSRKRSLYENYISPLGVPLPNLTVPLHANDPAPVIIAAGQDLNANGRFPGDRGNGRDVERRRQLPSAPQMLQAMLWRRAEGGIGGNLVDRILQVLGDGSEIRRRIIAGLTSFTTSGR